jgi:hypothetical protein
MASCPGCGANVTVADIRRAKSDQPGSHCPQCDVGLAIAASSWWWLVVACLLVGACVLWIGRHGQLGILGPAGAVVVALAVQPVWWRFLVTLKLAGVPPASTASSPGRPSRPGGRQ